MKKLLLKLIRSYQRSSQGKKTIFKTLYMSDLSCRFLPTCAEYSYQAIDKYGIFRGGLLSIKRIFKCHPWNQGGIDKLK